MIPLRLSLTFDDGPDPVWTPLILEELSRLDVPATFFIVASHVGRHPWIVRRASELGHEIGLHCHRHIRHSELTERQIDEDTRRALEVLGDIGLQPRRWRTPWGVCTRGSVRVAERYGLELVRWNVDTHDWRGDSAPVMYRAVASQLRSLGEDATLLMHDGLGPGALRDGADATLALLAPLVALGRARSLDMCSRVQPVVSARRGVLVGLESAA